MAYDGTDFAGWQYQPGLRTAQQELEDALSLLQGGRSLRTRSAGRTDAGVHARRQVADCELRTHLDDARLKHSLRCMLPPDLRAQALRTVDAGFHSRRDAVEKVYRYRVDSTSHGNPLLARYALHHPHRLDRQRLDEALRRLPGRRDWSGFTASSCVIGQRVRTLTRAEWREPEEGEGYFVFAADGFLTHMARNLVGTLLEIARGRMEPQRVEEILERGDRRLAGPTAPAHGLILWDVRYPNDVERAHRADASVRARGVP